MFGRRRFIGTPRNPPTLIPHEQGRFHSRGRECLVVGHLIAQGIVGMKGRIDVDFHLKMSMLVIYVIKVGNLFFYSYIIKLRTL